MRDQLWESRVSSRRRWDRAARACLALAVTTVAGIALLALPAAATSQGESRSAIAFWDLNDARHTRVSVQGGSAAAAQDPGSLFLFVTQSFCDTGTDELVFRSFFSQSALDAESFRVHPLLKSAALKVATNVNGSEQRLQSCTSPSGFSFTSLGRSSIEARVAWDATSDLYEVQPGVTARDAVATGSITGTALSPGPLGASQFAQLRAQTT